MPFYKKPHRDTIIANTAATLSDIDVSSGTLTVDEVNSRVGIGTNTPSATLGVDGNVVVEPGGKLGIGLTAPDCPLDVNAANDLPQAIIRYGTSYKTDLLTTSNGMFRITPTARTLQVDTGDTNGGNIQFTKAGGTVSGAISWDTGDKDVTLYSDANLYLGAGGSAADLTLNADGTAQFGGAVTATGITIGNTAITASGAELNYCDGVTSAIQTQLDSKGATAGSQSIVTVGALNSGSITSGFSSIDVGSGAIATTGQISSGDLLVGGTATLAEGKHLSIGTPALPSTDLTSTGLSAQMLAGGAIGAFQTVCIHTTSGEVVVTDANAQNTMPVIGIAPAAISDTATGTILLQGFIRDDSWAWTPGGILYASETAGEMTQTAPTTSGARVQALGVSLSADVVYWNPSLVIVEVD